MGRGGSQKKEAGEVEWSTCVDDDHHLVRQIAQPGRSSSCPLAFKAELGPGRGHGDRTRIRVRRRGGTTEVTDAVMEPLCFRQAKCSAEGPSALWLLILYLSSLHLTEMRVRLFCTSRYSCTRTVRENTVDLRTYSCCT
eukprot:COSAG01_NODE_12645_length_1704_cov_59.487850_1_plen_139_part_00